MSDEHDTGDIGNSDLVAIIQKAIAASGPITLARFMEFALFHLEHGYYMQADRKPGRGGDFITSPEISPYFGLTVARQMVECWMRLDQPESWTIREYGAGVGGLAYDVLAGVSASSEDAYAGLTYELVELNPHLRSESERSMAEAGLGDKIVVSPAFRTLPEIEGVVLANEVADAMPAHRLLTVDGEMQELYVGINGGEFVWQQGVVSPEAGDLVEYLQTFDLEEGSVLDVSPVAASWFGDACERIRRGYAVIIDYGYPADTLFRDHRLGGTVRGYSGHTVTDDPFVRVGTQDLTAHVDFTALQNAGEAAGMQMVGLTNQGAFLSSLGLGDFLLDLQKEPNTDTQTYLGSQAVALRLIDPGGLGRFSVMVMAKKVPNGTRLKGFEIEPPRF